MASSNSEDAETRQPRASDDSTNGEQSGEELQSISRTALIGSFVAMYLTNFLASLDRTVLAPAIPRITDRFNSIEDIAWYGSSYLLPLCCFQLLYGRLYQSYSTKWLFIASLVVFAAGSAVSGSAPSSAVLIGGRALSGIGAGGIYGGGVVLMIEIIPLPKRPVFLAGISAITGISAAIGPVIGGALTDNVTWRWCLYINLPITGLAIILLFLSVDSKAKKARDSTTLTEKLLQLDPLGTCLLSGSLVCLLLAIQWGGTTYAWSNARIIVLFVLFGLLLIIWGICQVKLTKYAILTPRIATQRTIAFAAWFALFLGGSTFIQIYYMTLWFQAIKGVNAIESGIRTFAWIIPNILASVIAGRLIQAIGYYKPFMIIASVFMSIGAGLMTTLTPSSGHAQWIGFQVLSGLGVGFGFQQSTLAAQAVLSVSDASVGVAIMLLMITLGGAVFLAVGQSVFTNQLVHNLSQLPGFSTDVAKLLVHSGATDIRHIVSPAQLGQVLDAYNGAIVATFRVMIACSTLTIIGAVGVEWKSIKKEKSTEKEEEGESRSGSSEVENTADAGEEKK